VQFTILGAGALGSILAAHLQRTGHDVSIIARGQRAMHVQEKGINLHGLASYQQNCPIVTEPSRLSSTEVLILTAKTYHHQTALEQVKHIKADAVFSVANGVLKTEQIESAFGPDNTLGCMADFSGELLVSGDVLFSRNISLQIGGLSAQGIEKATSIAEAINTSGINCSAVTNIRSVEWSKLVPWVAFLAISVLTRLDSYKFLLDPGSATLMQQITKEMYQLAQHLNIELIDQSPAPALSIASATEQEAVRIIQGLGLTMQEKAPKHRMSALQDLENGRPLEVEETIGDALKRARDANIKMPTLETCYILLSAINRNLDSGIQGRR
jgi:2-dehydropantoate 2-reductase